MYHIGMLYSWLEAHAHAHTHARFAHLQGEREPRCTRAYAWRMCTTHMHVHADGHSGHVLVESVRADCLLVSCPGTSTCTTTRSACCRRASLTSSRRFGEWGSEGGRVYGAMGGGEGVCGSMCGLVWYGTCVCGIHACMCLYIDMGIQNTLSYSYLSERVLFIGTRYSNLYTAVDTPAEAAWLHMNKWRSWDHTHTHTHTHTLVVISRAFFCFLLHNHIWL